MAWLILWLCFFPALLCFGGVVGVHCLPGDEAGSTMLLLLDHEKTGCRER